MQSIIDHIYSGRSPGRILGCVPLRPGFYSAVQRNLAALDADMNLVSLEFSAAFEGALNPILDIGDLNPRLNGQQIVNALHSTQAVDGIFRRTLLLIPVHLS